MFRQVWRDEDGLTTVEYALLLSLVAVAAVIGWQLLGTRVSEVATGATAVLPGS